MDVLAKTERTEPSSRWQDVADAQVAMSETAIRKMIVGRTK
jgi:hypothetical protein